ncbi:MAG: hypothetical protein AMJ73_03680 [candidate division Zixibacteria bacterium SM1_73]|nr:MAG: hypothetical protein AMJ73_03680 [candidate division Zixibacteria bacterium SM1_73]
MPEGLSSARILFFLFKNLNKQIGYSGYLKSLLIGYRFTNSYGKLKPGQRCADKAIGIKPN